MRRKLILVTALVLACGIVAWGIRMMLTVASLPREAYASDWTSVFIIEHLRRTDRWPTGWEDLRDEYDELARPTHYAWTFEELQSLIDVRWDATLEEIQNSKTPIDLVRLSSGKSVSFNGNPNDLIFDYVKTGNDPHRIRERIGEPGVKIGLSNEE